jgi:hypothetical protein
MNTNLIDSKIELLEDQLENIERSGFFTEKEIDKASFSYRMELIAYKCQQAAQAFNENYPKADALSVALHGMTAENYKEGLEIHNQTFNPKGSKEQLHKIEVIDEIILTASK